MNFCKFCCEFREKANGAKDSDFRQLSAVSRNSGKIFTEKTAIPTDLQHFFEKMIKNLQKLRKCAKMKNLKIFKCKRCKSLVIL